MMKVRQSECRRPVTCPVLRPDHCEEICISRSRNILPICKQPPIRRRGRVEESDHPRGAPLNISHGVIDVDLVCRVSARRRGRNNRARRKRLRAVDRFVSRRGYLPRKPGRQARLRRVLRIRGRRFHVRGKGRIQVGDLRNRVIVRCRRVAPCGLLPVERILQSRNVRNRVIVSRRRERIRLAVNRSPRDLSGHRHRAVRGNRHATLGVHRDIRNDKRSAKRQRRIRRRSIRPRRHT